MLFFTYVSLLTALTALAGPALGIRILHGNDDGWAELNLRALYYTLRNMGHDVFVSAPAEDKSGSGTPQAPSPPPTVHDTS